MSVKAEDLADGRWPEILTAAGVDSSYFKRSNGPCPFCPDGGHDRYRWSDKYGGVYLCSQCTGSKWKNGFDFLSRHMGYRTFRDAADHVRNHYGIDGSDADRSVIERLAKVPRRRVTEIDPQKSIERMSRQWNESLAVRRGDPVDTYLRTRIPDLRSVPEEIRYHPALEYWIAPKEEGGRFEMIGKFPAMLVRGFDAEDRWVQLHKTYLNGHGGKADVPNVKKTDIGVGSNSFALRIGVPSDTLGVCEGIETGLASTLLRDMPIWPCHSSSILANFELPKIYIGVVKTLWIFADPDAVKNGRRAGIDDARTLADRARKAGLRSLITSPAKVGVDFCDFLE